MTLSGPNYRRLLVGLLLLTTQTGCLFTRPMWDQAEATRLNTPVLLVQGRGEPSPRFQAVYFVPASSLGPSAEPYLFDVEPADAAALARSMPTTQPASTRPAYAFELKEVGPDDPANGVALRPTRFVRVLSQSEFRTLAGKSMALLLNYDADGRSYNGRPVFAIDVPGHLRAGDASLDAPYKDAPPSRTSRVAFLPADMTRPVGPRRGAIALATLLTPFTVVGDVVATPVVIVMLLAHGHGC